MRNLPNADLFILFQAVGVSFVKDPSFPGSSEDAREAVDVGERPDLGRKADRFARALEGSDDGSDTRAGSLEGGASSGSERDADQDAINETLATEGMASADPESPSNADPDPVNNTGDDFTGPAGDPVEGGRGNDADAASG